MVSPGIRAVSLDEPAAREVALAGRKAATLAGLRAAGFPVPDGVVLPVGLARLWPDQEPPTEVRSAVERACARLSGPLAVRSSATWEDGATRAHAGETVTVLGVEGVEEVLAAIRRCLANGSDVAILLQRMVPAEYAGVAFTADPVTGERDVVRIAATSGLGDRLVGGEVVGTDLVIRRTAAGDVVEGDLEGMPEAHAHAVAALARRIEAQQLTPQDVEWALAGGEVQVLQARAITVLPVRPTYPDGPGWQKDLAHYPEPITPFGFSVGGATSDDAVGEVFDELGLLVRGLEARVVGGEVYTRPIPAIGSPDSAGPTPPAWLLGLLARVLPPLRARNRRAREALDAGLLERWVESYEQHDRQWFQDRTAELRGVALTELSDTELAERLAELVGLATHGTQVHFRLGLAGFHAMHALHRVLGETSGWGDSDISMLLVGHSPATRAASEAMSSVRSQVLDSPDAIRALGEWPHDPVEALAAVDTGLAGDLAAWIDEHGWGCVNYDAGAPVLAERPALVTRLVLTDAEPPDHAAAEAAAEQARSAVPAAHRAAFETALRHARRVYPLREDNTVIVADRPAGLIRRWMLEVARRLSSRGILPQPEDAAYLTLDELRDALRTATRGEHLVSMIVRRRGEEAYVRAHPGPVYLGAASSPPDISRLPAPLRTMNEPLLWAMRHEYPEPPATVGHEGVRILAGVAAAPGVAEGVVRVIRGHADLTKLVDGEVLVCRVTTPAWAPIFPLAVAVVADGGGVLSHAAIAAREHGLPAVLGVGNATSVLNDGDRVRVDGGRGRVTLLG